MILVKSVWLAQASFHSRVTTTVKTPSTHIPPTFHRSWNSFYVAAADENTLRSPASFSFDLLMRFPVSTFPRLNCNCNCIEEIHACDCGVARSRKQARTLTVTMEDDNGNKNNHSRSFRVTSAASAKNLTDGVLLKNTMVVLPWMGYGTYKLGKEIARQCTLEALRQGYRCIDTAFIYGGESTERQVGLAIKDAMEEGFLERQNLCLVTKHWRKYHGYEPSLECLRLSLMRLELEYVDLWLMHWPGPAWKTMTRSIDEMQKRGPWHYAVHPKEELPTIRAETWRAMEDSYKSGKVKAIGVCNFTIQHLKRLKKTATIWPPAVNQIECHPLFPQPELVEYCGKEGIVVQAYSSLGGQDVGKKFWRMLFPLQMREKEKTVAVTCLSHTPPVLKVAQQLSRTPAQVLLRWALEKNMVVVPKTTRNERMIENAKALEFSLSPEQVDLLDTQLQQALKQAAEKEGMDIESMARLCWRNDPLRDLDFD
jgi:diketogulonate reductase-like aldo/keto reductase